jgi:hypothetical protein
MEIDEPRPGCPSQGYKEVVGHDGLIPACGEDRGGVDLQKLDVIDHPIVLVW